MGTPELGDAGGKGKRGLLLLPLVILWRPLADSAREGSVRMSQGSSIQGCSMRPAGHWPGFGSTLPIGVPGPHLHPHRHGS